jgi:hypothetical protein
MSNRLVIFSDRNMNEVQKKVCYEIVQVLLVLNSARSIHRSEFASRLSPKSRRESEATVSILSLIYCVKWSAFF